MEKAPPRTGLGPINVPEEKSIKGLTLESIIMMGRWVGKARQP